MPLRAQAMFASGALLGVRVINLGATGSGLLPIAGALKDILLVGVAAELLGTVGDVDDRGDVGDQRDDRDRGGGAGVERGVRHKDGLLLEVGEHLGKHAPNGQRKGAVLDPAALVPDKGSISRCCRIHNTFLPSGV